MQKWEEIVYARDKGRAEGHASLLIQNVESIMKNFNLDLEKACGGIGTTVEEYHQAKETLQKLATADQDLF